MERELPAPSDYGRDDRDLGDEPPASYRDTAPDVLAPIDISAPVSGHVRAAEPLVALADTPEQSWDAAAAIVVPLIRPAGTQGMLLADIDATALAADAIRNHSQPIVDEGPCDLVVVYAIPGTGFDVIVNADHLLSWGIEPAALRTEALANLATWSKTAPWTDEVSGDRRLISSDTGDGWDAARILLPEVRERLAAELGDAGRVLIGLPERHLLIAGALRPGDDDFATLFSDFVLEHSGGADEPVDRRVFELVDGRLVEFSGLPATA
jgi:hypothetical protein